MSRSRKRSPAVKGSSGHSNKWSKRQANRAVRRWKGSASRKNHYRRLYEQWDLCDYSFYLPWRSARREKWERGEWEKWYFRK